jgi:hypothetical protein
VWEDSSTEMSLFAHLQRETQPVPVMLRHENEESSQIAISKCVFNQTGIFITGATNLALWLPAANYTDTSHHELVHGLDPVIGVVSALKSLWTVREVPALCYREVIDVSNRIVECGFALDIATVKDARDTSGRSTGPKIFTADEMAKAKRLSQTCFHVVSGALEKAKSKTPDGKIAM